MPTAFGRDLDDALARAVRPREGPAMPAQDVPYDLDEARGVMTEVVRLVNRAAPSLDLRLVSVDGVRKATDAFDTGAGKGAPATATFEAYVTAYSVRRNVAVKLFAVADVVGGSGSGSGGSGSGSQVVPRYLVQGSVPPARDDDDGLQAASDVDALAAFEPALRL